jgi:hypothetical protein
MSIAGRKAPRWSCTSVAEQRDFPRWGWDGGLTVQILASQTDAEMREGLLEGCAMPN